MSDIKKRSRKSKIEARECDYEVVNEKEEVTPPVSQKIIRPAPKLITIRAENIILQYEHDYCRPGYQRFAKFPLLTQEGLVRRTSLVGTDIDVHNIRNHMSSVGNKMNIQLVVSGTEGVAHNGDDASRMCKYEPELLYKFSQQISSESTNLADKILDIELRNMWGTILHTPHEVDPHEQLLQKAIEVWQVWVHGWKYIRKSPLFYQCHICTLAWWRLHDFQQHIKTHDSNRLQLFLKELVHECLFVASYQPVTKLIFINIEGSCWKCGNDLDYHKDNSCVYQCNICQKSMYTCEKRRLHDSDCLYPSELAMFNISLDRKCSVCNCILDSFRDIQKHMIQFHSVPSDLPSPNSYKTCFHCKGRYYQFSEHNCSKSAKNAGCKYCCRKFATKQLAVSHMESKSNGTTKCRVCFEILDKQCMEVEHILDFHSDNYGLAYKCTICADQYLLFLDEMSVKKHRQLWHHKKSDKRRNYYENVLFPTAWLENASFKKAFQKGSEPVSYEQSTPIKYKIDEDDDFSVPELPNLPTNLILTSEVAVTVDEVDIKKESVEYDENGEIDYEEMLKNMFNIKSDKPKSPQPTASKVTPTKSTNFNIKIPAAYFDQEIPTKADFDIANVRIKEEPVDDIDITENPVEMIRIKSEPVDDVTVETDATDIKEHFIFRIKDEPIDGEHPSVQTFQVVSNQITTPKKKRKIGILRPSTWRKPKKQVAPPTGNGTIQEPTSDLDDDPDNNKSIHPNTSEVILKVLNPRGACKEKKMYVCKLCGFSARHRQYIIHKETMCSSNPGRSPGHSCSKCGLNFVMFRDYVLHFDQHGYDIMTCPVCHMPFEFQTKLLSHVQKHIKADYVGIRLLKKSGIEFTKAHKKVKCRKCSTVISQNEMFIHWETHLNVKPLHNDGAEQDVRVKTEPPETEPTVDSLPVTMNTKFLDPASLKAAIDLLTSTNTVHKACAVCYRVFMRSPDTKRHIIEHLLLDAHLHKQQTNNLFRCQICKQGFSTREKYKSHMREHGCMPIFKCELCNKNFSDSSNFAKHKKTHNVRVLICDICLKKFHSKAALEKHIADHENQCKIKCPACSKICMTPTLYRKHRYQAHEKNKFKCTLCDDIRFDSLQKKWEHDWQVHKQRKHNADCPVCLKSFRKFQDVRTHARLVHKSEVRMLKVESAALMYRGTDVKGETKVVVDK